MRRENPPVPRLVSLAGPDLDFSGAFRVPGAFSVGHTRASSHDHANARSFSHPGTITDCFPLPIALPIALPDGVFDAGIPFGHFL